MEIDAGRKSVVNFVVLLVMLMAMIVGLGTLIYLTRDAITRTDDALMQDMLARLAWISLALMGVALILLLLAVMHFVRSRFPAGSARRPTPYVDAWALAGQRMQVGDDEDDGPPAGPGKDESGA